MKNHDKISSQTKVNKNLVTRKIANEVCDLLHEGNRLH